MLSLILNYIDTCKPNEDVFDLLPIAIILDFILLFVILAHLF